MALAVEDDFPGLKWEIDTLRANDLSDDEITRAIADRAAFHQKAGYSNDAINAWLKGRPGPIGLNLQPGRSPTQKQLETLQAFERSRDYRKEPFQDQYKREAWEGGGLYRALSQAATYAGKFGQEMLDSGMESLHRLKEGLAEGPRQFESGVRTMVATDATPLQRVLGGAEAGLSVLSPVSAVAGAVFGPMMSRGGSPVLEGLGVPHDIAYHPVTQMLGETALSLPFMGPAAMEARLPGAVRATLAMEKATQAGAMTLAKLRKLPVTDPARRQMIENLTRVQEMGPEAPPEATPATPAPPPAAPQGPQMSGSRPTLADASQSERKVPIEKVETPEGPASVVDRLEDGETLVAKLPEDQPATVLKNLEEHTPDRMPPEEELPTTGQVREPAAPPVTTRTGRPPTPEEMAETEAAPEPTAAERRFTPEQARLVSASRVARTQGISIEEAKKVVEGLPLPRLQAMAATELREHRLRSGELTGRPGRPREAEARKAGQADLVGGFDPALEAAPRETEGAFGEMQPEGPQERIRKAVRQQEVIMPADVGPKLTPADVGIPVYGQIKKIADSKGYELYVQKGDVYLLKDGGTNEKFKSLREANAFLMGKDAKPKQPVEVKSSGTGETALEAAMKGKKLTAEQEINVAKQKAYVKNTPPLDQVGDPGKIRVDLVNPSEKVEMGEGQLIGTVEDVGNQHQAVKLMKKLREQDGLDSVMMKKPDGGFEVMYYKELTPEVSKMKLLYRRVLSKGEADLKPTETRALGKAFGISDEKIQEFVDHLHGPQAIRPISGGAPTPMESFLQKVGGYVPSGSKVRFANPLAGGAVSGSRMIRSAWRSLFWNERAYDFRMKGFTQVVEGMKKAVPDVGRAQALKEGSVLPATDEERRLVNQVQSITRDFAERARGQDMSPLAKELEFFGQDAGSINSVWRAFRDEFHTVQRHSDLSPALKAKLTPQEFSRYQNALFRYTNAGTVPKPLLAEMKDKLFNMSDVVGQWDNLPGFITSRLPREFFENFFLPKTGSAQRFGKNFYKDLESYIDRVESSLNFQPWLKQWDPVIRQLPGSGVPFTERGFLEMMQNNAIFRRPAWDEKAFQAFTDRVNHAFGHEYLNVNDANKVAQLIRNGWLRRYIGPDSALKHIMGLWQTWAESGRVVGPMMKYLAKEERAKIPDGVLSDYMTQLGSEAFTSDGRLLDKVMAADRAFTHLVMTPETFIWNFTKGTSFFAGVEEAAAKGLSAEEMIHVGMGRASKVVPNLQMTEQFMNGVEMAVKTQSGFSPSSRAPLLASRSPLGRLSTMLLTWPTHLTQFMQLGLRQGFADAMLKQEYGKLMRYGATVGFTFSLPYVMAQMGADVRNTWGPGHMLALASFPIWSSILDAYRSAIGQSPQGYKKNQWTLSEIVKQAALQTVVPQGRFGSKVMDIAQNIERGYGVDARGRFLYQASPYGELMRLAGINPEQAYQARKLSHTLFELSHEYRQEKEAAIDAMLGGDMTPAQKYMEKWNNPITPEDLQRALKSRQQAPEQRALRGFPRQIRPQVLEGAR